jgi:hypothetical protein
MENTIHINHQVINVDIHLILDRAIDTINILTEFVFEELEEVEYSHYIIMIVSLKNLFGVSDEESRREDLMIHLQ